LDRGARFAAKFKGGTGKTGLLLDECGSEKLCGALKDATRVTPSRDRELIQEVKLYEPI
jgi:hypothetical protein